MLTEEGNQGPYLGGEQDRQGIHANRAPVGSLYDWERRVNSVCVLGKLFLGQKKGERKKSTNKQKNGGKERGVSRIRMGKDYQVLVGRQVFLVEKANNNQGSSD